MSKKKKKNSTKIKKNNNIQTNNLKEKANDKLENKTSETVDEEQSVSELLEDTALVIASINVIRDELTKVPLDPSEKNYYDFYIYPLLESLYRLSLASYNLTNSARNLSVSIITSAKKEQLKDTLRVAYDMNDECEDLYRILKRRLKILEYK